MEGAFVFPKFNRPLYSRCKFLSTTAMLMSNVLILGPPSSGKIRIAQFLSNDFNTSRISSSSHSGVVYNFDLITKYYTANLNLLIEEFPNERDDLKQPLEELLKETYEELLSENLSDFVEVFQGVIFTLDAATTSSATRTKVLDIFTKIKELFIDHEAFFVVVQPESEIKKEDVDEFEDEVILSGFEFVNFSEDGKNEYMDKLGRDRLREILESHEWAATEPMSKERYETFKKRLAETLTQNLLTDDQVSLDDILLKLLLDKQKVLGMKPEERKEYVDKLVEEYLEFF